MPAFLKTIIRCAVDVTSRDAFIDVYTGQTPEFWNSTDIQLELAFFKGNSDNPGSGLVDMSVFESITAQLMAKTRTGGAYFSRTIQAAAINSNLLLADWQDGTDQHVKIAFTAAETNLPMGGLLQADFWLVISGVTNVLPKANDTLGGTNFRAIEDGVPIPDGPLLGGNLIPGGAVYNGGGQYVLALSQNKVYKWTDGGANDTDLVNGTETINVSNANFTAQGATVTLRGVAGQAVTAVVRGDLFLTADESDARYQFKAGDLRLVCPDDGNTYKQVPRLVDGTIVTTWILVSGNGGLANLVCPDDGHTYALTVRLVDGAATSVYTLVS